MSDDGFDTGEGCSSPSSSSSERNDVQRYLEVTRGVQYHVYSYFKAFHKNSVQTEKGRPLMSSARCLHSDALNLATRGPSVQDSIFKTSVNAASGCNK